MCYMNQKIKNTRSTSKELQVTSDLEDKVVTPSNTGEKPHLFYAVFTNQGQLYPDLTGTFPVRSRKGTWYVMIVYSFDFDFIRPVAMKSKSAYEWLKAFVGLFQELKACGFKPKIQTMDNATLSALKTYFTENYMPYRCFVECSLVSSILDRYRHVH
jgi:hypothetical protein